MNSELSDDPPSQQNGQSSAEAIDPSFGHLVSTLNGVESATATNSINSAAECTKLPDDEQTLKRTWLTLLPTEQVIDILLKLDEGLPRESDVKKGIWPLDLKAAVFHAAVARIIESSGGGTGVAVVNSNHKKTEEKMSSADGKKEESKGPLPTSIATAAPSPVPTTASPLPSSTILTHVPPLIPPRRPSPPTSTTAYQAAASSSTSLSSFFSSYPYTSGSVPYSSHHPYQFPYAPPSALPPPRAPVHPPSHTPSPTPAPPPGTVTISAGADDEDDLPSYEEMLVQALTVHNDPAGTAPKQLFQWMAATYPLQANFRPSASQALQKAYKRGRFEKNSEGRYRLNPRWEGGNTSRRTTRRPQSYSKAVLNPSPSSHPPSNTSQYPPQHYTWTYGGQGRQDVKSQSPVPVVLAPQPQTTLGVVNESSSGQMTGKDRPENENGEDHKSCMEAAYSILHALNITSASMAVTRDTRVDAVIDVSKPSAPTTKQTAMPEQTDVEPTGDGQNRAALQGTLALLAAQLAEIASSADDRPNSSGDDAPLNLNLNLNLLQGLGIEALDV